MLALSLAAIQWLPGLEAIRNSQRGSGVFAAAGSLPRRSASSRWSRISTAVTATSANRQFFSQYNLPEVGLYLGVLPLVRDPHAGAPKVAEPAAAS